ncbi:menaquinol oxidoreductase [Geomonas sp. Red69]|uniref:Menaquinol oxidoreductase n=1 Tax=Geomonas diazotrophica TaxID=2843197 RepID=A0ABX8JLY6_9BACT|nr:MULTISPECIES: menaquinol oxidoreductase [Geomonas]MBU5635647.1 menaquinol oxidoreductase [Geomonas diazotrophica]QWV98111.1 menaquinol oxidoreductase [Geomonas nitrogeniifigens]QXE87242.1 menaquinol oxidoreductase [Geomonas nitrogeniifigens]
MEQAENNKTGTMGERARDAQGELRQGLLDEIGRLKRFSNRGLWALSLFLLLSTAAWRDFWFLPRPQEVVATLGAAPKPLMISLVLVLYTFSAIILSLSRMMGGVRHPSSFCHVGYLAGFYLFYYFAEALQDNYWAVFGAGFTILCLESYRIWTFCSDQIGKRSEQLAFLERNGRMPPEEDEESLYD